MKSKVKRASIRTYTLQERPGLVYTVLLFLGLCYGAKMYCQTGVNISQELFKKDGVTNEQLSLLFSSGYVFSFFGKAASGPIADTLGGRTLMVMSVVGTILPSFLLFFIPKGPYVFPFVFCLWNCMGFFALGSYRIGVTALAANWIPVKYLGRFMSLIAMSPLLADGIVRLSLAPVLQQGWRTVCLIAGLLCLGLCLPACIFVTNSPPEAEDTIQNAAKEEAFASKGGAKKTYMEKLKPMLCKPALWILTLLSGTLFGTRNLFMYYATSYLSAVLCHEADDIAACLVAPHTLQQASLASSVFSFLGAASTILIGNMKDALPERHRAACVAPFVCVLLVTMSYLGIMGTDLDYSIAVTLIGLGGFLLFGPWKILGNAFAMDVGGKELKGTAVSFLGLADSVATITLIVVKGLLGSNWSLLFFLLAALSLVSLLCATAIWVKDLRAAPAPPPVKEIKEPLVPEFERQLTPEEEVKRSASKRRVFFEKSVQEDRTS